MASEELSAYELERLEHIKRNHEQLVRLGLVSADSKPLMHFKEPKTAVPKRQKKMMPSIAPDSLRRSSRVAKLTPEYDEKKINNFGDDDREVVDKSKGKGKKRAAKPEWDDDEDSGDDEQAEILASTTAFLQAAREALLQFVTSHDGQAPETSDGWRAEAVKRWGEHCGNDRNWEAFVTSRLSKPPPPSPHDLLQEYYVRPSRARTAGLAWPPLPSFPSEPFLPPPFACGFLTHPCQMRSRRFGNPPPQAADMWQLLCCCVLMSRVSSWSTKHRCISGFFQAYHSPSAFLEQVVKQGKHSALKEIIASLGLFDDRLKGLVGITEAFLLGDDEFMVDLKEHKIRGIGEFGWHSWLIFCRDGGATLKANDAALTTFCNWRKKSAAAETKAKEGEGKVVD